MQTCADDNDKTIEVDGGGGFVDTMDVYCNMG